jgi:hypothetical protein
VSRTRHNSLRSGAGALMLVYALGVAAEDAGKQVVARDWGVSV